MVNFGTVNSKVDFNPLLEWYEKNKRDFPWRVSGKGKPNPYYVWLAEIMSQQTQMATLLPFFFKFINQFPTIKALAQAKEAQVLAAWTGLGYYSRARNLHKTAKVLAKNGVPKTAQKWLELRGVGPYTSAAIVSQCFDEKEPVWDGNVLRVCARLSATKPAWNEEFKKKQLLLLKAEIQKFDAGAFNQSLMELGALICKPQNPACERCPLQSSCKGFNAGNPKDYPNPKPRKDQISIIAKVFVLIRKSKNDYKTLLIQRKKGFWFQGMWDFPSELGGVRLPVMNQSFFSELNPTYFGDVKHSITHHKITLQGFVLNDKLLENKLEKVKWISLEDLASQTPSIPIATTTRKVTRQLMKWLSANSLVC